MGRIRRTGAYDEARALLSQRKFQGCHFDDGTRAYGSHGISLSVYRAAKIYGRKSQRAAQRVAITVRGRGRFAISRVRGLRQRRGSRVGEIENSTRYTVALPPARASEQRHCVVFLVRCLIRVLFSAVIGALHNIVIAHEYCAARALE